MTKMILPLDFFLLGGAFISPCENEELTVESGIPACQLAKPNSLEYPENNRSQPVEQPEEYQNVTSSLLLTFCISRRLRIIYFRRLIRTEVFNEIKFE